MSNKYKIHYSNDALDELEEIRRYILYKLDSLIASKNTVRQIKAEINELECMPYRYPLADLERLRAMGLHKFSVKKYTIYYHINEDTKTVDIRRIVYGARDIENLFPH